MAEQSKTSDLFGLIGVMAIGVGTAWALQVLGLGGSTALSKLMWVLAAATIAGAGAGLIYTSIALRSPKTAPRLSRLPT